MGTAGGLGYTQTGEIAALEQLIAQKEREARRFSSESGFDFSGQTAELGVLKDRLAALRAEGAAEQSRVSDFISGQNQQYQNLFDHDKLWQVQNINAQGTLRLTFHLLVFFSFLENVDYFFHTLLFLR